MPSMTFTRRGFLAATCGVLAGPAAAGGRPEASTSGRSGLSHEAAGALDRAQTGARTRLVLLGTAGGPTPKLQRAAPAQAIVVGDRIYLVDCGDGVARQMRMASLPYERLRAVFITHHHSDHNAGYGPLFLLAWASGLARPVDVYGPPPVERMTRLFLEGNEFDIATRIADEGRPPLAPLIRPHEITAKPGEGKGGADAKAGTIAERAQRVRSRGRLVFSDDRITVSCVVNDHPPIEMSFAYRFDTGDRSIVISGDTTYSESVRELARDADVLVHEALYAPYWRRPDSPQPPAVVRHILASHTDAADAGRLAAEAGVKTLVLTHFVPSDPAEAVSDEQWLAAARRHFLKGEVILGKDLMEV